MGGAVPRKIGGGAADFKRGVKLTEWLKCCATDGTVKAVSARRIDKQAARGGFAQPTSWRVSEPSDLQPGLWPLSPHDGRFQSRDLLRPPIFGEASAVQQFVNGAEKCASAKATTI